MQPGRFLAGVELKFDALARGDRQSPAKRFVDQQPLECVGERTAFRSVRQQSMHAIADQFRHARNRAADDRTTGCHGLHQCHRNPVATAVGGDLAGEREHRCRSQRTSHRLPAARPRPVRSGPGVRGDRSAPADPVAPALRRSPCSGTKCLGHRATPGLRSACRNPSRAPAGRRPGCVYRSCPPAARGSAAGRHRNALPRVWTGPAPRRGGRANPRCDARS